MRTSTTWDRVRTPGRPGTGRVLDEPGIRFGTGQGALVAVTTLLAVVGPRPAVAVALLALSVVGSGAGLRPGWSLGLAVSAWALYTGFVEHTEGTLTWREGDLLRLLVLVLAGLLASSSGVVRRAPPRCRTSGVVPDQQPRARRATLEP